MRLTILSNNKQFNVDRVPCRQNATVRRTCASQPHIGLINWGLDEVCSQALQIPMQRVLRYYNNVTAYSKTNRKEDCNYMAEIRIVKESKTDVSFLSFEWTKNVRFLHMNSTAMKLQGSMRMMPQWIMACQTHRIDWTGDPSTDRQISRAWYPSRIVVAWCKITTCKHAAHAGKNQQKLAQFVQELANSAQLCKQSFNQWSKMCCSLELDLTWPYHTLSITVGFIPNISMHTSSYNDRILMWSRILSFNMFQFKVYNSSIVLVFS